MKYLLLSLMLSFSLAGVKAQNREQNLCVQSFTTSPNIFSGNFSSVDYANDIISKIIGAIGLKPNFEVRAADVPNAAAVVYNQKRYVLYNPAFINALVKAAGNEWAAVSVL